MIEIKDKTKCCGCTACYSVCPNNCITMKEDSEGFLYPNINNNDCVNCGLCEKVCPYNISVEKKNTNTKYCIVQNKDAKERGESTAGGFFSLVANKIILDGGVVYAAGYDINSNVVHKRVEKKIELSDLRGSKYVQSTLQDTFNNIKRDLKNRKVLFVGTPCQVHGLKNFIGENINLFTIDLLCLGVSSPGLFKKYIRYLNKKYENNVVAVQFRNKQYGYSTANIRICFRDGRFIQQTYDSKVHSNLFFKGFKNVRLSCYECEFREKPRVSDFTIGDCSDVFRLNSDMDDDLGTTSCWIHTNKGHLLFHELDNLSYYTIEADTKNIIGGPRKQIKLPETRGMFFRDAEKLTYSELIKKYHPKKKKDVLIPLVRYILEIIPFGTEIKKRQRMDKLKKYKKNVDAINRKGL